MINISDIKVGVITLEGSKLEFEALQGLAICGIVRENIEVKHIPSAAKATLMTLFFAEYTEVDCVYIALPEGLEEVKERLAELELQCRMPIGTSLRGLSDISDMSIHGRRGLVFNAQKTYYELTPSAEANALKFLMLYEAYTK